MLIFFRYKIINDMQAGLGKLRAEIDLQNTCAFQIGQTGNSDWLEFHGKLIQMHVYKK